MTLGKRLKEARKKAGYTQKQAAEKLKIGNNNLSNYERDYRDPDTDTLLKLSDLYNVSTDYLLGKEDVKTKEETDLLNKTINDAIQELKDEDTLLFMNDGEFDEETALLVKKALKNGLKFIDELKKKE
ncbi:helix-turn-helix domain-containing protein [Bacillus atrophaeus]|uniref:helix-turn-helix domain-containing protein n=1 Tax=Bacillus atrophaeus TaxID=1452 RepID=UPI00227FFFF1|nr:helix-turn-helix domain-containing protein [Bacillus atrophaeus]MCY8486383.1 helix-turn-helix domain-containing protein [Bacillus atrophaeus]MCY8504922.1 helix-turn-helix domain-containing protein [Bacillus atrophaeus]MCY8949604.1 helix-turn-helix domain-containing protein [Bacillus atrophaeus]MCY8960082.1 helix-turn-helix domain-containing protein [Bacillus atrophaeus]MCY8965329.1 helix-turn-helix domain-containing protein [Bacillus atrophaeus]